METVELSVDVLILADNSVLVSDGDQEVWLPLSKVECNLELEEDQTMDIEIPEWLASDRGLI